MDYAPSNRISERNSNRLNCAHHVDQPAALKSGVSSQVGRILDQQLLDLLRPPDELAAHREDSRDNTGNMRRGHAGTAALDVVGAGLPVQSSFALESVE